MRIGEWASLMGAAVLAAGVAGAQGNNFVVTNASDYAVISFQTAANGKDWSKNWISGDAMLPGESFQMNFSTGGDCVVPTYVTFEDNSAFDVDVDYCSTATLVLYNDTIEAE